MGIHDPLGTRTCHSQHQMSTICYRWLLRVSHNLLGGLEEPAGVTKIYASCVVNLGAIESDRKRLVGV